MPEETTERVKQILEQRDFSQFIGLEEDQWFEAKGKSPYDLDTARDRYELAKDVSSFANAEGGFIIIGLEMEQLTDKMTEKAASTDLFCEEEFPIEKYNGIIKEHVYPRIKDLSVKWLEDSNHASLGIGCIEIPPQDQNNKLFLIKNVVEDSNILKQIVFGIAQRAHSSNNPLTIHQLHQKIKYGMSTESEKLTRIEDKVDLVLEASHESQRRALYEEINAPITKLENRIKRILSQE